MSEYNYSRDQNVKKIKKIKFHEQTTDPLKLENNALKDFLLWLAIGIGMVFIYLIGGGRF